MAVLGILSLFQITLLPGLIVLSASRYQGSLLRRLLLAFGFSLTANFLGVFALGAAGVYGRHVTFALFGAELVVLAWLEGSAIRRWLASPLLSAFIATIVGEIRRLREVSGPGTAGLVRAAAAIAALLIALFEIAQILVTFVANWGTIFKFEDAVFSWNRWALDWYLKGLPAWSYHYPQLVPANWSISYVFMNAPLQYIGRGMMPLFMLVLLLAMLDLGWKKRTGPYLATLVAVYMYPRLRIDLTEGMADLPVSCMAFLSFCCIVAAHREACTKSRTWYLVVGAVLAAGAAITKQPGVFFLAVYPVLAYVFALRGQGAEGRARALRLAGVYAAIVLVIVVPYYVYAEVQIRTGQASSELGYVTNGIFGGLPVPQRIVAAWQMFLVNIKPVPTFLIVLLGLIALGDQFCRWVIGLIVVPWALLWAAFASYDPRNLALAIPFMALSVGTGAATVLQEPLSPVHAVARALRRLAAAPAWVVVASAAALIATGIGFGLSPTPERLIAHHRRLERELGNAALNARLYAEYDKQPFTRRIVTDYVFMFKLPELGRLGVQQEFVSSAAEPVEFAEYQKRLLDPNIGYLLLPVNAVPSIVRDVEERIQRGDVKLLFRAEGYLFVEIVRR